MAPGASGVSSNEGSMIKDQMSTVGGGAGDGTTVKRGHLAYVNADTYQAATLNKILPPGFRIEIVEILQRNYE